MVRIAESQARSLFTITSPGLFIDTPLQGASSSVQCQSFGNKKQTNKVDSSFKTFPHEVLNPYLKYKVGTESSFSHRFFSFPVCCCFLLFTIDHHTKSSLWMNTYCPGTINGHPTCQELSNNSHLPPLVSSKKTTGLYRCNTSILELGLLIDEIWSC
jgi:hypothetical protein